MAPTDLKQVVGTLYPYTLPHEYIRYEYASIRWKGLKETVPKIWSATAYLCRNLLKDSQVKQKKPAYIRALLFRILAYQALPVGSTLFVDSLQVQKSRRVTGGAFPPVSTGDWKQAIEGGYVTWHHPCVSVNAT